MALDCAPTRYLQSELGRFASGPLRGRPPDSSDLDLRFIAPDLADRHSDLLFSARLVGSDEPVLISLSKQLTLKFGPLSPEHAARLASATAHELDLYIERILTAAKPEDVFEPT